MSKVLDLEPDAMITRNRQSGALNYDVLSPREREIMLLAAKGYANKEIARELKVSTGTIKLHLHRVYQKLGINSRFSLAVLVRKFPVSPSGKRGGPLDAA
jgi:DNA-binding NarL/FixJ family response regulator